MPLKCYNGGKWGDGMSKHTPGPWQYDTESHSIHGGRGLETEIVHSIGPGNGNERHANGEFIVNSCNCHDDLLAVAKQWLAQVTGGSMYPDHRQVDECDCVANTRAAIAKAEGK